MGDGSLPTLDISLAIDGSNQTEFKFFEKGMATNLTIQNRSAMGENMKYQSLSNEVIRRMLNNKQGSQEEEQINGIDEYGSKLLTSGFTLDQVRRIIVAGLKGYEGRLQRCKDGTRPLYRTAKESMGERRRGKLLAKSNWFKKKGKRKTEGLNQEGNGKGAKKGKNRKKEKLNLGAKTVLFVDQTPGGELAKRLRELLQRLEPMMGFSIRIVERTGTKLKDLFPLNTLWDGMKCERGDCPPCNQGGEKIQNCKKRNLVYESICAKCNPGAIEMKGEWEPVMGVQSLYVGETCRSLHERSKEHMEAYRQGSNDSHVLKHHLAHHQGEGEPKMLFRAVKFYSTALGRQIGEATRIRRRGASSLLNSKGEYNRCRITRLTLEESEGSKEEQKEQDGEVEIAEIMREGAKWEREKAMIRELESKKEHGKKMGVLDTIKEVKKRRRELVWEQGNSKKNKKKRQFSRVGEHLGGAGKGADRP